MFYITALTYCVTQIHIALLTLVILNAVLVTVILNDAPQFVILNEVKDLILNA